MFNWLRNLILLYWIAKVVSKENCFVRKDPCPMNYKLVEKFYVLFCCDSKDICIEKTEDQCQMNFEAVVKSPVSFCCDCMGKITRFQDDIICRDPKDQSTVNTPLETTRTTTPSRNVATLEKEGDIPQITNPGTMGPHPINTVYNVEDQITTEEVDRSTEQNESTVREKEIPEVDKLEEFFFPMLVIVIGIPLALCWFCNRYKDRKHKTVPCHPSYNRGKKIYKETIV